MTSSWVCCASSPVRAVQSERIIAVTPVAGGARAAPTTPEYAERTPREAANKAAKASLFAAASARQDPRSGLVVGLRGLQHACLHFELSCQRDHRHELVDDVDVAAFDIATCDLHVLVEWRRLAVRGAKQAVVAAPELLLGRVDQLEPVDDVDHAVRAGLDHRDRAIASDRDLA